MKKIVSYGLLVAVVLVVSWYAYGMLAPQRAPAHIHTIEIVNPGGPAFSNFFRGFEDRHKEYHHENGESLKVTYRDAKGDSATLKELITAAIATKPDFLVTITSPATAQALKEANSIIPILTALGDPVEHGYIKSLKDPGVLATGIAQQNIELTPKRFEILKEVAPHVKRVAVVYDTTCGPTAKARPIANTNAPRLGLEIVEFPLTTPTRDDLAKTLATISGDDFDALMFYPHGTLFSKADLFLKRAEEEKLITIMPDEESLALGAPISYGPSYYGMGELLARMAEKMLTDGVGAGDIPFEQPKKIDLVINLTNAKKLGLVVPDSVLTIADKVIE